MPADDHGSIQLYRAFLTTREQREFARAERTIARGLRSFLEVGLALKEIRDIGIAGEHLVLAATELGLGTCWIGWIKSRAVARIVGWPPSVKPVVVIAVGYACDPDAMPPVSRRKPLTELVRWL